MRSLDSNHAVATVPVCLSLPRQYMYTGGGKSWRAHRQVWVLYPAFQQITAFLIKLLRPKLEAAYRGCATSNGSHVAAAHLRGASLARGHRLMRHPQLDDPPCRAVWCGVQLRGEVTASKTGQQQQHRQRWQESNRPVAFAVTRVRLLASLVLQPLTILAVFADSVLRHPLP